MLYRSASHWLFFAALLLSATGAGATQVPAATAGKDGGAEEASEQRTLFEAHLQLEEKVVAAIEGSADAARAFGKLLSAEERRRLQAGCSSLVRNPDNGDARDLLRTFIDRHPDQEPRVVARYCFDPSLHQLQQEVRATRRALQQRSANGDGGKFDFRLQRLERSAQDEKRRYAAIQRLIRAQL